MKNKGTLICPQAEQPTLPSHQHRPPCAVSSALRLATPAATPDMLPPPAINHIDRLNIPGFRDVAVEEYSKWQVKDEVLKAEFRKGRDIALADGLNLE